MSLGIGMVTIDCADPQRLAAFWPAALGEGNEFRVGEQAG